MIPGEFDSAGCPYIKGFLVVTRLGIYGDVKFLLDTGAESTCLHPADSVNLNIPFGRLLSPTRSHGIGGSSLYHRETAVLSFLDDEAVQSYRLQLHIAEPTNANTRFPSLLGRDVLNRWRIVYDPTDSTLEIFVRSADHTMN